VKIAGWERKMQVQEESEEETAMMHPRETERG
jgi:hypothetical protein